MSNRPWFTRRERVFHLLDECWCEGRRSHQQLKGHVRRATGTACSPKLIVAWKRDRHIPLTCHKEPV
ncbi:hypothetical protein KR51_00021400 [Rubidibacter lacunae KORDI 51-2]|uniref:Transposase n=1 Tax=Rubidibacter lacunae KORDI 51-2 TaxID=582515 RepID=U5DK17_9CHRO|nr:hypothetical protein [Rubidibacter lacunae]ERN41252.1 hypothetical protein KR51_00021400 [Rubidibacter lacunae KORDI 51-2]